MALECAKKHRKILQQLINASAVPGICNKMTDFVFLLFHPTLIFSVVIATEGFYGKCPYIFAYLRH